MRVHLLAAALTAAALTACSSEPQPASAPLESPRPSSSPSPIASAPAQQRVGKGSTQQSIDPQIETEVTVLRVRQPLRPIVDGVEAKKGHEHAAAEVKLCVNRNATTEVLSVSWYPWALSYTDGTVIEEMSSWSADWWDVPLYPQERTVPAGRCVKGWVPFEVPRGSRPELVTYQPVGRTALEWRVK